MKTNIKFYDFKKLSRTLSCLSLTVMFYAFLACDKGGKGKTTKSSDDKKIMIDPKQLHEKDRAFGGSYFSNNPGMQYKFFIYANKPEINKDQKNIIITHKIREREENDITYISYIIMEYQKTTKKATLTEEGSKSQTIERTRYEAKSVKFQGEVFPSASLKEKQKKLESELKNKGYIKYIDSTEK